MSHLTVGWYERLINPCSDENNMYLPSCFTKYIYIIVKINLTKQTRVC